MVALNCNVEKCVHNTQNQCCNGDVLVGGCKSCNTSDLTCCESFQERVGETFSEHFEHPDRFVSVECKATSCVYNDCRTCISDHVNICGKTADCISDTRCASFMAN